MKKIFFDLPYNTFSAQSKMAVVCPHCGKRATVRPDKERGTAVFRCDFCFAQREIPFKESVSYLTAACPDCGGYFRTELSKGVHGQRASARCPQCGQKAVGEIFHGERERMYEDIENAQDPYFHYPLFYRADFKRKPVWAINRAHLQYLIDYLSADIRTVPPNFYEENGTLRTQSDALPAFMKSAKNREDLVKLLQKLSLK